MAQTDYAQFKTAQKAQQRTLPPQGPARFAILLRITAGLCALLTLAAAASGPELSDSVLVQTLSLAITSILLFSFASALSAIHRIEKRSAEDRETP